MLCCLTPSNSEGLVLVEVMAHLSYSYLDNKIGLAYVVGSTGQLHNIVGWSIGVNLALHVHRLSSALLSRKNCIRL